MAIRAPRRVLLIGTGGTIAGSAGDDEHGRYRAGAIPIGELLAGAPGLVAALARICELTCEQPFSIGSQHFTGDHWITLARRIHAASVDDAIDGIVIAHGTDTIEETAFALDLLAPRGKAVVLTGAMRPATAPGADGPANLRAACQIAADPAAAGRGVLVCFNDRAWLAAHVGKRHATSVQAFDGGEREPQATIAGGMVRWQLPPAVAEAAARLRPGFADWFGGQPAPTLPRVALVWQHVDADPRVIDWHCAQGARGIVLAATGAGTMPVAVRAALAAAAADGRLVVRASRVAAGPVLRDSEPEPADRDSTLGFVAAGNLAAVKARILAQCWLASQPGPLDTAAVQRLFDAY